MSIKSFFIVFFIAGCLLGNQNVSAKNLIFKNTTLTIGPQATDQAITDALKTTQSFEKIQTLIVKTTSISIETLINLVKTCPNLTSIKFTKKPVAQLQQEINALRFNKYSGEIIGNDKPKTPEELNKKVLKNNKFLGINSSEVSQLLSNPVISQVVSTPVTTSITTSSNLNNIPQPKPTSEINTQVPVTQPSFTEEPILLKNQNDLNKKILIEKNKVEDSKKENRKFFNLIFCQTVEKVKQKQDKKASEQLIANKNVLKKLLDLDDFPGLKTLFKNNILTEYKSIIKEEKDQTLCIKTFHDLVYAELLQACNNNNYDLFYDYWQYMFSLNFTEAECKTFLNFVKNNTEQHKYLLEKLPTPDNVKRFNRQDTYFNLLDNKNCNINELKQCIDKGLELNDCLYYFDKDSRKLTPSYETPLTALINSKNVSQKNKINIIALMVEKGVDLDKTSWIGYRFTPIKIAFENDNINVFNFLLEKKALLTQNILASVMEKNTTLYKSLVTKIQNREIRYFGVSEDINQRIEENSYFSQINNDSLRSSNNIDNENNDCDFTAKEVWTELDLFSKEAKNISYDNNFTGLYDNNFTGLKDKSFVEAAQWCLEKGMSLEKLENTTPLIHLCGMVTTYTTPTEDEIISVLKLLITKKININQENADGQTALKVAIKRKRFKVCKFLVDNGAKIPEGYTNDLKKISKKNIDGLNMTTSNMNQNDVKNVSENIINEVMNKYTENTGAPTNNIQQDVTIPKNTSFKTIKNQPTHWYKNPWIWTGIACGAGLAAWGVYAYLHKKPLVPALVTRYILDIKQRVASRFSTARTHSRRPNGLLPAVAKAMAGSAG